MMVPQKMIATIQTPKTSAVITFAITPLHLLLPGRTPAHPAPLECVAKQTYDTHKKHKSNSSLVPISPPAPLLANSCYHCTADMRVLVTGGSGFLGAHCVKTLLQHSHSVVFTSRSKAKGDHILNTHPKVPLECLSYVLVEDVTEEHAFKKAIHQSRPIEAVIHTASPYHFRFGDPHTEMLDPCILGTTNLLKTIHDHAPTVKHISVTSSFAAMVNVKAPPPVYDESSWNPSTIDQAITGDKFTTWRASKTFAEEAAWEFCENEKPGFSLSTILPPLMFGPLIQAVKSDLSDVNQSTERIRDMITGKMRDGLAPTGILIWADVRDVALAHVRAIEGSEAAGKRFFVTEGWYSNAMIADVIKKKFPEIGKDMLPVHYESDLDLEDKPFEIDNRRSREVLGMRYMSLEQSIKDCVQSMLDA